MLMNFLSLLAQRKEAKERAPRRGVSHHDFNVETFRNVECRQTSRHAQCADDRASMRGLFSQPIHFVKCKFTKDFISAKDFMLSSSSGNNIEKTCDIPL